MVYIYIYCGSGLFLFRWGEGTTLVSRSKYVQTDVYIASTILTSNLVRPITDELWSSWIDDPAVHCLCQSSASADAWVLQRLLCWPFGQITISNDALVHHALAACSAKSYPSPRSIPFRYLTPIWCAGYGVIGHHLKRSPDTPFHPN